MFYVPAADVVERVFKSKGYILFSDSRGYDLNLFGIRTSDFDSNKFNDWIGVLYLSCGIWNSAYFPATTDPGTYWRENLMNLEGTAVLKPGQYRGAYKIGEHKGKPAFQQVRPVTVYRDANRDKFLDCDPSTEQSGVFGINIHRASPYYPHYTVNRWSAGCQVIQDALHFNFLLELAYEAAAIYGNIFTYTLFEESDFTPYT